MCFVVGSPDRVAEQLAAEMAIMGADRLDVMFQVPGLPDDVRRDSMRRFAAEVAPALAARRDALTVPAVQQEAS